MKIDDSKYEAFVAAAHKVAQYGLVQCSSGNLSWRVGPNEAMLSASGVWLAELTAQQIALCDLSSGQCVNGVKATCEAGFHVGILKARTDANVVLHFQSPFATALACGDPGKYNLNLTIEVPVYIGDQTRGDGKVRTLAEQVSLETRTRMLNPKWYEGMLKHGYEGVRQIEVHVTNTMGWSATTGQVAPWVYQRMTETFVLDDEMRERLAALNPTASAKVANRLLEAHERNYWTPDDATLEALRRAGEELEDRLEGITEGVAA